MKELPEFIASDVHESRLICGYPKTGRTWLRFMMANALSEEFELGLDVDLNNVYSLIPNEATTTIEGQPTFSYEGLLPKIEMSHKPHQDHNLEISRTIFMTRDPRDIMVSHWLHDTNQVKIFNGSVSDHIRDSSCGITAFLDHLEGWSPHLASDQVVTYEAMRKDPAEVVSLIFKKLDVVVSDDSIEYAVYQGEIDRMRKIEISTGIAGHEYDRSDPDARRIRKGRIGGYVDYLNEGDLTFIDDAIKQTSKASLLIIAKTPYDVAGHE